MPTLKEIDNEIRLRQINKEIQNRTQPKLPPGVTSTGITSVPVPKMNWADKKIAEYEREEFEKQDLAAKRKMMERDMTRKKFEERNATIEFPFKIPPWVAGKEEEAHNYLTNTLTSEGRREAARTAGGMAGGMGGHPVLGAGVVGGGGEALYQIGQQLTGSPNRPQTPGEAAKRIGIAGGLEATEEGVSRGVMKLVSPGQRIPLDRAGTLEYMKGKGILPTAGQMSGAKGLTGILEDVTEASWTGGGPMRAYKNTQREMLESVGDDIVQRFGGLSDIEAGNAIKELMVNQKLVRQTAASEIYAYIAKANKNKQLPTAPFKDRFSKIIQQVTSKNLGNKKAVSLMPSLENDALLKLNKEAQNMPDFATFEQLNWIKKRIGNKAFAQTVDKTGRLIDDPDARVYKELYYSIDELYRNPAYGLSKDSIQLLDKAHKMTTDLHDTYDKDLIRKLVKEYPEKIINDVIHEGGETYIDEVLKATGPEGQKALRGAFVRDLITDKGVVRRGQDFELDGGKFLEYLHGIGDNVLDKFMSKTQKQELEFFGDALRVYAAKPAAKGGGMTMKIIQAGAGLNLLLNVKDIGTGQLDKTSMAIVFGPQALAYLFTNKSAIRYLSNTLISEGGPREVTRLLTRLLADKQLKKYIEQDKFNLAKEEKQLREEKIKTLSEGAFGAKGY